MAEERLILVDEHNRAVGSGKKLPVHRFGLLHRAFSIFIVDDRGRILLQQRSRAKYHSGGLWANSCCGHPHPGERTITAARRRLNEEIGARGPLSFGFFSRYQGDLGGGMQENEFVYVYFGPLRSNLDANPAEVSALEFVGVEEVRRRIAREPHCFTYWLRHYFRNHFDDIARLAQKTAHDAMHAPPIPAPPKRRKHPAVAP